MNMNFKLGPFHFSTKPAEVKEALVGFYNDYIAPAGRLIKDKINAAIERHGASKRQRLGDGTETDEDVVAMGAIDFDDAEAPTSVGDDAPDEIDKLEPVGEPDCDD